MNMNRSKRRTARIKPNVVIVVADNLGEIDSTSVDQGDSRPAGPALGMSVWSSDKRI